MGFLSKIAAILGPLFAVGLVGERSSRSPSPPPPPPPRPPYQYHQHLTSARPVKEREREHVQRSRTQPEPQSQPARPNREPESPQRQPPPLPPRRRQHSFPQQLLNEREWAQRSRTQPEQQFQPAPPSCHSKHELEGYKNLREYSQVPADGHENLRKQARACHAEMERLIQESRELEKKSMEKRKMMEILNNKASDMIFKEKNKENVDRTVDLHGLFVKEAEVRAEEAILKARNRGDRELILIVGKGLHSLGGEPKLKPAIEKLMIERGLRHQYDPRNDGRLIVYMDVGHQNGQ